MTYFSPLDHLYGIKWIYMILQQGSTWLGSEFLEMRPGVLISVINIESLFQFRFLAIEEDPLGHGLEAAGSVVESHGNSMNHQSWQIQSTWILLRTRKFLGWIWLKCGNILNSTFWSLFKNLFHLYKSANGPTTTARSFHMARTNISTRPPIWLYDMVHITWVDWINWRSRCQV